MGKNKKDDPVVENDNSKRSVLGQAGYVFGPILFFMILYIGIQVICSVVLIITGQVTEEGELSGMMQTFATMVSMTWCGIFIFLRYRKENIFPARLPLLGKRGILTFLAIFVAAGGLAVGLNRLIFAVVRTTGVGLEYLKSASFQGDIHPLIAVLAYVIVAPLMEEIVFRGIVCARIETVWGKTAAVILSSVVFALYHINPVQMVYALLMGLIMGYLRVGRSTWWMALAFHMGANAFSILVGFLS